MAGIDISKNWLKIIQKSQISQDDLQEPLLYNNKKIVFGAGNSQDSRIAKKIFINMFDSIENNMFNF